jgi:hypothetical protein
LTLGVETEFEQAVDTRELAQVIDQKLASRAWRRDHLPCGNAGKGLPAHQHVDDDLVGRAGSPASSFAHDRTRAAARC